MCEGGEEKVSCGVRVIKERFELSFQFFGSCPPANPWEITIGKECTLHRKSDSRKGSIGPEIER